MFPGLDLCYAGPAQPLTTAGGGLDDLEHDLSYLSVRRVDYSERIRFSNFHDAKRIGTPFEIPVS